MMVVFPAKAEKDFLEIKEREEDGKKICRIGCPLTPYSFPGGGDLNLYVEFTVHGSAQSVAKFLADTCIWYNKDNQGWEPRFWEPFEDTEIGDALFAESSDFWYAWFVVVNCIFKELYEGEVESIDRENYEQHFLQYEDDIDDDKYGTYRNFYLDKYIQYQELELDPIQPTHVFRGGPRAFI